MAVTNLGLMVPSSPGFIGPFHFFCKETLVAVGADPSVAFAYAVLVHAAFYVPVTLWGVFALLRYGVELAQLKSITRAVRNLPDTDAGAHMAVRVVAALPAEAAPGRCRWRASSSPSSTPSSRGARARSRACRRARSAPCSSSVTAFVNGQVRALPRRLQLAFSAGLIAFAASVRLRAPTGFSRQTRARRSGLVDGWAFGGFIPGRKLFRLIRSTALLAFYDHPLVARRLEPPEVEPRALGIRER
jgi:hypothetical protein